MRTSKEGIELIKHFEGYRGKPYKDIAGYWTIGIGHLMKKYENIYLPEDEAEKLLALDLQNAEAAIRQFIKVPLTQYQFDALASFTFNLGMGALQRSTLRAKINREDFEGAAPEFLKWIRAGGVVSKGLLRRRKAESRVFMGLGFEI